MPKIMFVSDPKLPRDWANKEYKKGWIGDMSQDEADRWVRRGVAEMVSENKEVIHGANLAAAQSSDEKVAAQQVSMQVENDAKAKAEDEAKAKEEAEVEAKAKAEAEAKAKVAPASTVSGARVAPTAR